MEAKVCGVKSSSSSSSVNHHQMIADVFRDWVVRPQEVTQCWTLVSNSNVNICFVCLQENSTEPCPQLKMQDFKSSQMLEFWDTKKASDFDSLENLWHKINRLDARSSDVSRILEQNISKWMCLEIKLKHRTWHALWDAHEKKPMQCKSTVYVSYMLHKLQSKSTFCRVVHIR